MKYSINYANMDKTAKHKKALRDSVNYLGAAKFKALIAAIVEMIAVEQNIKTAYKQTIIACSFFLGIEGYPVRAIFRHSLNVYKRTI
jgi:hypothetical protein